MPTSRSSSRYRRPHHRSQRATPHGQLSRRHFNLSLGASLIAAAAAPFSGLLRSRRATAAEGGRAKRLVIFFSPNGTIHNHWRPQGSGRQFDFAAGSILEPLRAIKSDLVIIDGLDFYGADNHEGGMAAMLTGGGGSNSESGGYSVDQYVANNIGGDTRFPSLELGVQTSAWGGQTQTRISYRGPGAFVPPDDNPASVFQRLFGNTDGEPGEIDQRQRQRQQVLNTLDDELRALQSQLGGGPSGISEHAKLTTHRESIDELKRSLSGDPDGLCTTTLPIVPDLDHYNNDRFPSVGEAQMDLLVAALACNQTRVASIQWAHTVAPQVFSWLSLSEGHHALSHMNDGNPAGVADFVTAERWFAEQFAHLVTKLKQTPDPDGDGNLLDTTLVVWGKELGDSRLHTCRSVPFVLAGQAGGALETGRYLRYDAAPHNQLLVSICHAMGLKNGTFGDTAYGTGPLPGLLPA